MSPYQLDGIDLSPQPTEHEWDDPILLGHDGDGKPFYAKYSTVTLRTSPVVKGHDWRLWLDGVQHDLMCPAPGTTNDWTEYGSVWVENVREGTVSRTSGTRGVEMRLIMVEV